LTKKLTVIAFFSSLLTLRLSIEFTGGLLMPVMSGMLAAAGAAIFFIERRGKGGSKLMKSSSVILCIISVFLLLFLLWQVAGDFPQKKLK